MYFLQRKLKNTKLPMFQKIKNKFIKRYNKFKYYKLSENFLKKCI